MESFIHFAFEVIWFFGIDLLVLFCYLELVNHDKLRFIVNFFGILVVFKSLVLDFDDFCLKLLNKRPVDLLPTSSQFFHIFDFLIVGPFNILDSLSCKDKEMALTSCDGCAVACEEAIFADDVYVTEVTAFHVCYKGDVFRAVKLFVIVVTLECLFKVFVDEVFNVHMQLDLALFYEVQLFCVIPLLVQNVTFEQFEWLEFINDNQMEFLRLVP